MLGRGGVARVSRRGYILVRSMTEPTKTRPGSVKQMISKNRDEMLDVCGPSDVVILASHSLRLHGHALLTPDAESPERN